ncbi:MAG: acyl-CoA thioesterase [Natronospirillum sp.]
MSETHKQFTESYPIIQTVDLQWGDMDALKHVNNAVYFRYFENVRIAYMAKTSMLSKQGMGPVLAATDCQYKRPLTFPDRIVVGARVAEVYDFGCLQEYAVYSLDQDAITTRGSARIVLVDAKTGQKVAMNNQLLSEISALEGREL